MRSMDLTALLGSRICHDLISPLGAIGNGVELLTMSGVARGPEISLIAESIENANARIRLFRLAFGAALPGQVVGRAEISEILGGLARGGRMTVAWQVEVPVDRAEAKLAFLCLQCLDSAMPWGGRIGVSRSSQGVWTVTGESTKLREIDGLWAIFEAGEAEPQLAAADIQFALAPLWAAQIGMDLARSASPGRIVLTAGRI